MRFPQAVAFLHMVFLAVSLWNTFSSSEQQSLDAEARLLCGPT